MFNFLKKLFGNKCCEKSRNCSAKLQEVSEENFFSKTDAEILKNTDKNIVIGKILKISKHPDPKVTKVRVTQTEISPGEVKQILCGGVNIKENRYVPVATIGTKFPDFEIGERKIRGVLSQGMICSRTELGLSKNNEPDHGIWLLDDKFAKKLGQKIKDLVQ